MNEKASVFLLLNGEKPIHLPDLGEYDLICATDGAVDFLSSQNIRPDLLTGDFDSSFQHPKDIEIIHTPNQDFTDFAKALNILHQRAYRKIDVYGASGKEQDHFLGNLHVALQWKNKLNITFYDNHGRYFFSEKKIELKSVKDKTISLFPFPSAKNITTEGLEFPLKNEDLSFEKRIGTRNKARDENVRIQYTEGELLIFINN